MAALAEMVIVKSVFMIVSTTNDLKAILQRKQSTLREWDHMNAHLFV